MLLLRDELIDILDGQKLTPYFQPIISVSRKRIIGYEALIRGPSNSPLHSPLSLFDVAERFGLIDELEFACREITIRRYAGLALKEKLFLNVSSAALLEPKFKTGETLKFLKQYNVDPASVVIELTEHQHTDDYPLMREAVTYYRDMGFEIALDDLGAGYSGLRLWSELLPDYVKIDKHFIQGLHEDPIKLNFVQYIQNMAAALNCHVIAEGIETVAELHAIERLGITHAQGYYYARPAAIPIKRLDYSLLVNNKMSRYESNPNNSSTVAHIVKIITPISSETQIRDVVNLFQCNSGLTILPLVDNDWCSGIIVREIFFTKLFSGRYGMEWYGKKAIKSFIDKTPLSFDQNSPLEVISQQLTSAMRFDPAFIITDNGKYKGIGTTLDLLEGITHRQIHHARHANSLALLSGVSIDLKQNHLN